MKKRTNKRRDIIQLITWLAIIVLLNYVGAFVFERFDLTAEKRFTLSDATKDLVSDLEDVIYVRVYLDGDLPAGFKRLQNSTREMLDEFRAYSNNRIEYDFINPSESPEEKVRMEVYRELTEQGLQYSNLQTRTGDKVSEQIVFPGAIFTYKGEEIPLQLLKSQLASDEEIMLNNSIQQLEYEFSSTIKKLVRSKRQRIGFTTGHGELDEPFVADISTALNEFYTVERVKIDGQLKILEDLDALIIADPDSAFTESDKFIIDQFVMTGGKVLWLIDPVFAAMDSLRKSTTMMGIPRDLNLDDQLFKYGVRVNSNLLQDLRALPIPVMTGYVGNQPKTQFFPWLYSPLIMTASNHPVVSNIDPLKTEFISSIDTVARNGVRSTILLKTSNRTKVSTVPARISINMVRQPPDERQFTQDGKAVAVLLEGKFTSVFVNRIPPALQADKNFKFFEESTPNKMLVISDGDIIKNEFNLKEGKYFSVGFDRYTNRLYGNRDFLLNAVNYLLDDSGLIEVRSKEFKIRLLDRTKADNERLFWQLLNTVAPLLLVLIFGAIQFFMRRRKYARA